MTSDASETVRSSWPADPQSAWAQASRSPDQIHRLTDPPDVDSADAASMIDWIEDQKSMLPMFAIAASAIGVIIVGGLFPGVLPLSGQRSQDEGGLWAAGTVLLVAAIVLWGWELINRVRRRRQPPQLIPEVQLVLCQLYPARFSIADGDGYRETCIAIAADTSDAQAARVLTAFRLWLDRLHADAGATIRARNEGWAPSGATVFASEEIFGPEATGGFLVRRPNPPADGWGVLITPRRPRKFVGELRFANVRQWTGFEWSR